MKILDLTGIYPDRNLDFEGRSVQALDRALVRGGAGLTVIVLKPWLPLWLAAHLPAYRHLAMSRSDDWDQGVRVLRSRHLQLPRLPPALRRRLNARLLCQHVLRLCRDWDLDLIHVQGIHLAGPAALAAAALELPLAVTLRDGLDHLGQDPRALHALDRRVFDDARAFMAIGPGVYQDLERFVPDSDRRHLAPNGIDVEEIDQLRESYPRPDGQGRIVSVANLFRWKGIHECLRALAGVRDLGLREWTYTIVGDGPYRAELEELAAELGIADRVTFRGHLPHGEAVGAINQADVFLLPSFMEAFGNVFAEAAVCGVPAIGCRGNGPDQTTIEPGKTGLLVSPQDVPELTTALARLLGDPEEGRRMGRAARRRIERPEFGWDHTAGKYLEIFDGIVQRTGGRG